MKMFLGVLLTAGVLSTTLDPVSYQHEPEAHHSLHPPLDKSQVYWNFGGSTVLTRKYMRLTPDTQDRRGWMWNEYPIESVNWEVEFSCEVFSKPHFGGDGFGFWVLAGDQDPTFSTEPDFLNGPVFGLKSDFIGMGVMFDVYDNDNKRNNPSVFALANMKDNKTGAAPAPVVWDHDNDYEGNMITAVPEHVPGHVGSDATAYRAHKCVADFRNTGKAAKVLVKLLHKVLHVYIDSNEGTGYKFCLAVDMPYSFVDYHIAFTAATGQVADVHDIKHITTRYLAESDRDLDDTLFAHYGAGGGKSGTWGSFFFGIATVTSVALVAFSGFQVYVLTQLTEARIDLVRVCTQLNQHVLVHWIAHGVVFCLTLFTGNWLGCLFQLPVVSMRIYLAASSQMRFDESSLTGQSVKGHSSSMLAAKHRLYFNLGMYVLLMIFYVNRYSGM